MFVWRHGFLNFQTWRGCLVVWDNEARDGTASAYQWSSPADKRVGVTLNPIIDDAIRKEPVSITR